MNRIDWRPRLLVVAALLLLTAVVADLIHDAEANHQRLQVAESSRRALDEQSRRSIAELRTRAEESLATGQDRAELIVQYQRILEALARIERSLETSAPIPGR